MRLALAFFAAMALLLLAGCGGSSAQDDPFVGPWRPVGSAGSAAGLVITKGPSGYEAFIVSKPLTSGPMLLQRSGDTLVFPAQNGIERQTFTFHSDSGRLTDKDGSAPGIDFELVSPARRIRLSPRRSPRRTSRRSDRGASAGQQAQRSF
jgi:hypothetical protein